MKDWQEGEISASTLPVSLLAGGIRTKSTNFEVSLPNVRASICSITFLCSIFPVFDETTLIHYILTMWIRLRSFDLDRLGFADASFS